MVFLAHLLCPGRMAINRRVLPADLAQDVISSL